MTKASILTIIFSFLVLVYSCNGGNKNPQAGSIVKEEGTGAVLKETMDLNDHPGRIVYNQLCLPCHQADGNGVPGMYPPIIETEWVNGDKSELISIVIHGMDEEIEVDGEIYNTIMAPLPHLSDQEVSDVLNYVRGKFGKPPLDKISPTDVAAVRKSGPSA